MRWLLLLLSPALILITPLEAAAESDVSYSVHPTAYLAVGLMIVDVGVSLANGLAVARGTANKPNGYFGVGLGVASLGFAGVAYALSDDDDLRDQFAIIMGSAGTAALVTGVLAVRQAGRNTEAPEGPSNVRVSPAILSDGGGGKAYGLLLKLDF
jgi:hypothetical protein